MPAVRKRKAAGDRKAEIVAAAIRLAGETGPDRVTTQRLADAVGVSQPAVFRHFPTKADIWLAVGAAITEVLARTPLDDGGADPLATLEAAVARHLDHIQRNPAIPAILFSRELHVGNEALRRHFEGLMQGRRAGFAGLLERARIAGQLRPEARPEDLAALILASIQGLAMRWSLEERRFDLGVEGTRLIGGLIRGWARP